MKEKRKIKIYVDVYNGEKYLRQCIESVLNQTYKDFEFYIVDNGSKDSSPQIIEEYAAKDSRILTTLSTENIQSRWINWMDDWDDDCFVAIIDHDDWWAENYLIVLLEFLEKENLDLSFCLPVNYHNDTKMYLRKKNELPPELVLKGEEIPIDYINLWTSFSTMWGCLLKVGILKKIKSRLLELSRGGYCIGADTMMVLEYINHCNRIGIINKYLYYYRQHNTSMTSSGTYNTSYFRSMLMIVTGFENYAKDKKILIIFNQMFFAHLIIGITKILDSTLTTNEKIETCDEILSNEMTIKYLVLSNARPCDNYDEFKTLLIQIIKIYDISNIDIIRNIIQIISPKCGKSFNVDTFDLFKNDVEMLQFLVHNDSRELSIYLLQKIENDTSKSLIFSAIKSLLDKENLVNTINNVDFILSYKTIIESLIINKLDVAFDKMTDIIMLNEKLEYTEIYLTLYINVSNNLGVELGELVGKLKLAEFLFSDNRIDESITIAKELVSLGFQSDELDTLLLKITNSN